MNIESFYDEHVEKVYKFFYVKCLDRHLAEDLTSETFVTFVNQQAKTTIQDHKKYLYGIMRTVWIEFLKRKYRANIVEVENVENFEDYSANIIDDFEASEGPVDRLMPFVNRLPNKQKQVLMMRIYEGRTVSETAEVLGKDANYVKTTYQRALQKLRSALAAPYREEVP